MSLPTTGLYKAQLAHWTLSFDGEVWSGDGADFDEMVGPALASETPRHRGNHRTVDVVAAAVLDKLWPGHWREISCEVDGWKETLDPEAVD